MNDYRKLIPLLYPLNLEQNEWFVNLYRNLILSIYIENPSREFTVDELINFIFRNYNLKIKNIPELEEILSRLSKESNELLVQNSKYSINPSRLLELEENFIKILGFDDSEDNSIIFEFEASLKDFIEPNESHEHWDFFYEIFCLPIINHFYLNLSDSGLRSEKEILQNYKSYINKFPNNKDEIHNRTLLFLKNISPKFFKKHLIACIFFESLEGDIKDYNSIFQLLENPDNLDFFLERNILFIMEILSTMYSIEERIKASTSSIASILFEDSFHRNLYYTEMNNKQNEIFKKTLRIESQKIVTDIQNDWNQIKLGFTNVQSEFSTLESKVEILKEGINKHSKLIVEAKSGLDSSVKSKHEASINILKNKNVGIVNKITEFSLFFFPVIIIILSAIYFFQNEFFYISCLPFGIFYIIYIFYKLLEILINKKLIDYHKAELTEETKI